MVSSVKVLILLGAVVAYCSSAVIVKVPEATPPSAAARPPRFAQHERWAGGIGGGGSGFRRKYVCLRGRLKGNDISSWSRLPLRRRTDTVKVALWQLSDIHHTATFFVVQGTELSPVTYLPYIHIHLEVSKLKGRSRKAAAELGARWAERAALCSPIPSGSERSTVSVILDEGGERRRYTCVPIPASVSATTHATVPYQPPTQTADVAALACEPEVPCPSRRPRRRRSADRRGRSPPEAPPEMLYTFIEQAVQPGAHVTLKCTAAGEPPPRFRWTLDAQPLQPHHGAVTEGAEGGAGYVVTSLSLSGTRVEDGGRYECRAANAHGTVAHTARLNVYGPPYIRAMGSVRAVAGSEATLTCPYYGFPISTVRWEQGGVGGGAARSANSPRYRQIDGQLVISDVDRQQDAGPWVCSVTSPGGELARREIQVVVVSPPVISPLAFPPGLRAGERTQLSCTVSSGDMPVYFSWLKDGLPLSTSLQIEERSVDFFSLLMFKSLSAVHSGLYTCVVSNTAGKANTSVELAIKVPPYWGVEPADAAVLLGGALTVSCEARGHPPPRIYWTKLEGSSETAVSGVDGVGAGMSLLDGHVLANGSLRLEVARATHTGRYRCRADNGVEPPIQKTLTIHVNEPARFEAPSTNVTARLGDTVKLACAARGDSPLAASWSHGGRALPTSDYRMSVSETRTPEGLRSELVVERADRRDSGLYRCQASNPYGRSDHFIHLAVQEPPEPPTSFRVVEVSSRSVRLAWRRPYDGNSPVLGYVLQYRRLGPSDRHHDGQGTADPVRDEDWSDADTHNVTVSSQTG